MLKELGESNIVTTGRPLPFVKKVKLIKDKQNGKKMMREVLEVLIDPALVKREVERRRRVRSRAPKTMDQMEQEAEKTRIKRRIRENIR